MVRKILVLFLCVAEILLFAQTGNGNVFMSNDKIFVIGNRSKSAEYVIDGNPYPNGKKFEKVFIDGYSQQLQDLRYNAYADEMEFLDNNETYYVNKINGLTIKFPSLNKTYIVTDYAYLGNSKVGYLIILSRKDAKFGLFKREKVELIPGEKSSNAYGKDANDYFAKEKDLYLVSKENTYYKLPKSIEELAELFSLDIKSLKEFSKSNKINFSKESDLIKLFDFINK